MPRAKKPRSKRTSVKPARVIIRAAEPTSFTREQAAAAVRKVIQLRSESHQNAPAKVRTPRKSANTK
ncbi:hypothetical protein [Calycomorphotria hydatis]|uniref:hypothetical protein n=1 Tax=Calycomorphotria hydatis TaxID=2528027 RepID=UPI0011A5CD0E|nr:hypothetical protein [Calycomorphotria hydatis]